MSLPLYTFAMIRVSNRPEIRFIIRQQKQGSKCTGVVDGSRTRSLEGSSSAGKKDVYIDWPGKTSRQILQILGGWGAYSIQGLAGDGKYSTDPSSGVAGHLALFTAVECRVVEEGAAFTVPLGAFEVLVPLRPWRWLGALLPLWHGQKQPKHKKHHLVLW